MERVTLLEGADLSLMARVVANGAVLTRTEISAANIQIFEVGSTVAVYTRTLALTADPPGAGYDECMFAAETTGAPWPKAGGMTFYYIHQDSAYHLDGGKRYKAVVTLTAGHASTSLPELSDYGNLPHEWLVTVKSVAGV